MTNLNRTTTRTFLINNPGKQKLKMDLLHQETFPSLHFSTLTLACVHLSWAVHGTFLVYRRTPVRQITCPREELVKDIIRFNQRKCSLRSRRWLVFMERAMGTRGGKRRSPLLFSSRYFSIFLVLDISPFALKKPAPSSQANEKAITPTSRKLYSRNALEELLFC